MSEKKPLSIEEIDKNFALNPVNEPDVLWHNARELPFSLHGVYYDEGEGRYRRMPSGPAEATSPGVADLAMRTAGGRLRFASDSPYVAVKCVTRGKGIMPHMTIAANYGFSLYKDGIFYSIYAPRFGDIPQKGNTPMAFSEIRRTHAKMGELSLYFPLYGEVTELYIGLARDAVIAPPKPYTHEKPVLFYGSSITQGGCASRPGNDYVSRVASYLDTDFINLGFSGCAKGEPAMVSYLASLDPSVYVIDYDHNAPSAEHLKSTHLPLYRALRAAHPNTPIVFMTKPDFENDPNAARRRDVIRETYHVARTEGDRNVVFIDGETLFGTEDRNACTVDRCHPNDLGFYRMTQTLYPVLDRLLNNKKG